MSVSMEKRPGELSDGEMSEGECPDEKGPALEFRNWWQHVSVTAEDSCSRIYAANTREWK